MVSFKYNLDILFNNLTTMEWYIESFPKIIIYLEIIMNSYNIFSITYYYLILFFFGFFGFLIYSYIFYFQQVILNSIYTYICCLKLLVENKKYNSAFVTLTNMNLKNYFILSGLSFYVFIIIYMIYFMVAPIKWIIEITNITHVFVDVFYFNDFCMTLFYLHTILLMNMLLIIALHIIIGLYMLYFDYLKNSSFILWTFSLFIINTLIFYYIYFTINFNV